MTALRRDTSRRGIRVAAVRASHRAGRRRDRPHAADVRRRRDRRARRRQLDDREDLPARQVRASLSEDAVHRLQRQAVHGERRCGEQEGLRHGPNHQSLVGHGRHGGDLGRRIERGRVLADHHQLHLAGARAGREDHRAGSEDHACRPHVRSVPAGQARPGRGALCRRAADHDRARLARSRIHREHTIGFDAGRGATAGSGRCSHRRRHRRPRTGVSGG